MLYPIQTLWGSKRFDSGISISFKRKCNIIMQTQYTKNITDPGRFELYTTLSKPTKSVMLEWNWYQRFVKITRKKHQNVVKSRFPGNFKTGHFKSLIGEMAMHHYDFFLSFLRICVFSFFFFLWCAVYVLGCCVRLVVTVMSCTLETTFKELAGCLKSMK